MRAFVHHVIFGIQRETLSVFTSGANCFGRTISAVAPIRTGMTIITVIKVPRGAKRHPGIDRTRDARFQHTGLRVNIGQEKHLNPHIAPSWNCHLAVFVGETKEGVCVQVEAWPQ